MSVAACTALHRLSANTLTLTSFNSRPRHPLSSQVRRKTLASFRKLEVSSISRCHVVVDPCLQCQYVGAKK